MPKKQNLKNKGNYVGNLAGKIQEQRLQDNRTRASFASLASWYSHFCRNPFKGQIGISSRICLKLLIGFCGFIIKYYCNSYSVHVLWCAIYV